MKTVLKIWAVVDRREVELEPTDNPAIYQIDGVVDWDDYPPSVTGEYRIEAFNPFGETQIQEIIITREDE